MPNINIVNVAQENFFYQFEEFTLEEEIILFELVKEWSQEETLVFNLEIYKTFTVYSRVKSIIDEYLKVESQNNSEIIHRLNLIKFNGIENIHALLESFGKKIIKIKTVQDLKFLDDEQERFFTMFFLSFQYLRTKKMRKSVEAVIAKKDYLSVKYLDVISFIFSTVLANGLSFHKSLKFVLLQNTTEIEFLTSDQPLINLKKDLKDERNNVKDFELYYPINPNLALVIHYDHSTQKEKYLGSVINEDEVHKLNLFLIKNSENFIFSNNIKLLEYYKNLI